MTAPRGSLRLSRQIGRAWPVSHRIRRSPSVGAEAGFTLVEVLISMVILVVGLLSLVTMLDTSVKASMTTRAREGATNLARQIVEDARTIPYAQIVPTSIESQLQTIKAESGYPLADSSSTSGWQIERRGITYTVAVKECAVDNPKDGLATAKTHEEAKTFCAGQENWKEGTVDAEPEDLKRIAVETSWTIAKHTSTLTQVSTLTAAGQAIGLIAKELKLVPPPEPFKGGVTAPVIIASVTQLTFSVSFPEGTTAIDWSLEGAKQKEITVSSKATSTTFSWTISGVSDGTYQVSAQAVNSTGVIGPPISIPVRLIREAPKAPNANEIMGGFNAVYVSGTKTEAAELQWKANSERDVIGYRVYGPGEKLICPESVETLSTATSCIDFHVLASETERAYSVVALYRNAEEELTESSPGKITIKRSESTAPNPATSLVATKNADGTVTLTWTAPSGGAAAPSFYRIYRGSTNYASRYAETTETTFKDSDATETHKYWVTAVSSKLVESTFSNEASG